MSDFTYVPIVTGEGKPHFVVIDDTITRRKRGLKEKIVATACVETRGHQATTKDMHLFGLDAMLRER